MTFRALFGAALFFLPTDALGADCPMAARSLGEVIQEDPASPTTETKLREVLTKCPDLAEAHFQLGTSLLRQDRAQEAGKSFQRAIELKRDPLFFVALANTSFRLENYKSAQATYEEALKLDPNSTKAMQGLGALYFKQEKFGAAEDMLRRAIQISPESADLFFNLGVVLSKAGRPEEALESFRAASERKSPFPEANIQLGSAYLRLGQYEPAERAFREAALHEPRNPEVWVGLGSALNGAGNYPGALQQFDKALEIDPKNALAQLNRAIVEIKSGKTEQGVLELQRLAASDPSNSGYFGALGWGLLQLKRNDDAEQALETALRLNPQDPFTLNNLGVLHQVKGNPAKAREMFERAKELGSKEAGAGVAEAETNLKALDD